MPQKAPPSPKTKSKLPRKATGKGSQALSKAGTGPIHHPAELNISRLNLISIQERVPDDYNAWRIENPFGLKGHITCTIFDGYGGVPHGLDADIVNALLDLFTEAGSPSDGVIYVTPYQILSKANLDLSGRYYENLRESIIRLTQATYTIDNHWMDYDERKYTTATFRFITEHDITSIEQGHINEKAVLKIVLAQKIIQSMLANYTKPVNSVLLNGLKRSIPRSLYRLLDARRRNPERPDELALDFEIKLTDWARECKLIETETSAHIKKLLASAHTQLIEKSYLKSVTYSGRGANTMIRYEFHRSEVIDGSDTAPIIKELKEAFGLPEGSSIVLINAYGIAQVNERIELAREVLRSGNWRPKSMPAFITDVIKNGTEKYQGKLGSTPLALPGMERPEYTLATPSRTATKQDTDVHQEFEKTLSAMDRDALIESLLKAMHVSMRRHFDTQHFSLLRSALERGRMDPADLSARHSHAMSNGMKDEFAVQLKEWLVQPPSPLL